MSKRCEWSAGAVNGHRDESACRARRFAAARGFKLLVEDLRRDHGDIEVRSPGTKHDFYFGFLARASKHFRSDSDAGRSPPVSCSSCGSPANGDKCAFCRLVERATAPMSVRFGSAEPST